MFKANKFYFQMKADDYCAVCGSEDECLCELAVATSVKRARNNMRNFPHSWEDNWFSVNTDDEDYHQLNLGAFQMSGSPIKYRGQCTGRLFFPFPYGASDGGIVGSTAWADGVYLRMYCSQIIFDTYYSSPLHFVYQVASTDCVVMLMYCNDGTDIGYGVHSDKLNWEDVFQTNPGIMPINAFVRSDKRHQFQCIKRWRFNLKPSTFYTVNGGKLYDGTFLYGPNPQITSEGEIAGVPAVMVDTEVVDTGTYQQCVATNEPSWVHEEYVELKNRRTMVDTIPTEILKGSYFFAYTSTAKNFYPGVGSSPASYLPKLDINYRFKYSDRKFN